MGQRRYWYFSKQMRIPDVDHPVRVVLFWKARGDQDASKALVSNRLGWEVIRMVLVYRYRWTGTETFHRDGKQLLGLGDCQVRTGEGQTRHVYLVSVAYSLLMRSLHQTHLYDWARRTLTTIGEACRAVKAETLAITRGSIQFPQHNRRVPMSTYPHFTLQSADVYTFTINPLDTLPLKMPGAIESRDLLRVLVFAAASRLSVHQACAQLERAPSGPTVLGTLASQFRDLDVLEDHLNTLLAKLIPKGLGKRGRRVAIDLVALPYHGTVDAAHQGEVCRSKAKGGTTHFFTYATAYAVVRGRRYTLAMCRVRAKQRMDSCAPDLAGPCGHLGHPH